MKNIDHIKYAALLLIFIITGLHSFSQKMVLGSGSRINVGSGITVINPGDLTINSGAILELTGNMTVSGTLSNSAGTSGLVIKSSSGATGSLIQSTDAVNGSVERYIADNAWHLVTPSTTGVTANNFYWSDSPKSWLTYHTESTNEWTYNISLATSMPVGQGWAVWLDVATKSDATATMSGALRSSNLSPTVAYTDASHGYNLVGNPFTAAIDWESGTWTRTNMELTMWVWNNGTNNYLTRTTGGGGTKTNGIIPVSQGFFVRSNNPSPVLTIPADARTHNTQALYKSGDQVKGYEAYAILTASKDENADGVWVGFGSNGSEGFDNGYDASKLFGGAESPQLYLMQEGREQSINYLFSLGEEEKVVPMSFKAGADGEQILSADLEKLPGTAVSIEDLQTGLFQDLVKYPVYLFSASKEDDPNRFLLHFKSTTFGLNEPGSSSEEIYIYAYGKNIYVRSTGKALNLYGTLEIFDIYGREIKRQQLDKSDLVVVPVDKENSYLIARVIKGNFIKTKKLFIN